MWAYIEDPEGGLASVYWRRLIDWHHKGRACWPPGHEPHGPHPYSAEALAQHEASRWCEDWFCGRVHDLAQQLIANGLPSDWDPTQAPLALYLTAFDAPRIVEFIKQCKKAQPIAADAERGEQEGVEQAYILVAPARPALVQPECWRLNPQLDVTRQVAHTGGMQLQPRIDWEEPPAPQLQRILCESVIVVGRNDGTAWAELEDAHAIAKQRYLQERERLCEKVQQLEDSGRKAVKTLKRYRDKLCDLDKDFWLQPLTYDLFQRLIPDIQRAAFDQRMKRYREALQDGQLLDSLQFGEMDEGEER